MLKIKIMCKGKNWWIHEEKLKLYSNFLFTICFTTIFKEDKRNTVREMKIEHIIFSQHWFHISSQGTPNENEN